MVEGDLKHDLDAGGALLESGEVFGPFGTGCAVGVGDVDAQFDGVVEEALHERVAEVTRRLPGRGVKFGDEPVCVSPDR